MKEVSDPDEVFSGKDVQEMIDAMLRDCRKMEVACLCDMEQEHDEDEQCNFCRIVYGRFHVGMTQHSETGAWQREI